MQKMNCDEISELLDAYFDGEVDALTTRDIEEHLSDCSSCQMKLAEIQKTSNLLRSSVSYYIAPKGLERKIRRSLPTKRSGFIWKNWTGQVAIGFSTFAIGILVAVFFLNNSNSNPQLADELVSNHIRSLLPGHLIDVASSDKHTVKPWFAGKIDFTFDVPDFSSQGFQLLGGRVDYMEHHQVAVLIYGHGKHIINLYVTEQSEFPNSLSSTKFNGYCILNWSKASLRYFAISDMENTEMQKFEGLFSGL